MRYPIGYRAPAVDEFITAQPQTVIPLLEAGRAAIHMAEARVQETLKWRIPFFDYYGNLCYLNPKPNYVILGFVHGNCLHDPFGMLSGSGKTVRHYPIHALADAETEALLELIAAAALYNERHQIP